MEQLKALHNLKEAQYMYNMPLYASRIIISILAEQVDLTVARIHGDSTGAHKTGNLLLILLEFCLCELEVS